MRFRPVAYALAFLALPVGFTIGLGMSLGIL
jgi:hypothetical protein